MWILFVSLLSYVFGKPGWITYDSLGGHPYNVTYTSRSLQINSEATIFISGSLHYPRFPPEMWSGIIREAKMNGLNMVEIYIFWNFHEQVEGNVVWDGNADVEQFVQLCAQFGLFVNLRVGPYVCAEWDYGGIPAWLGFKEGIKFRCTNDVWMSYMESWFKTVIARLSPYFASKGGPIALVQVENEYYFNDWNYINWCGQMAAAVLNNYSVTVPITMCMGNSANNTINTCNGYDDNCVDWIEENGQNGQVLITQPALWTENEGGFQVWGESPNKPTEYFWGQSAQTISYNILRWFARGGSHMNYYMYYGGNHFAGWAGASVTNMYASDANICPDGLPHEPKFSHLGALHGILGHYSQVLLGSPAQLRSPLALEYFDNSTGKFENGTQQLAFVYSFGGESVAFLENSASVWVLVQFSYQKQNVQFTLPAESVLVVDGKHLNVVFSSAEVNPATTHRLDRPIALSNWKSWSEPLGSTKVFSFP